MSISASSLHERLCELARSQAALDVDLSDVLLSAYRQCVHVALGYGSFREYAAAILGWSGRQTEERLRVAIALEDLPELRGRLQKGELTWSAVRELTRVATPETERDWIAEAEHRSVREVERLVSGRAQGELPSDPALPAAERKHVSLNLSPEAWALWEEARERLTKERGARVDDDALVQELAGRALAGSRDPGLSSYRIAVTTCDQCSRAEQRAGSSRVVVEAAVVEAAKCDAQIDKAGRATQTIPPRVRRAVLERHHKRCAVPGCAHSTFVDVHHVQPRSEGGRHDPELLIALCGAHHKHVHEARLVIRGTYSEGFVFQHADSTRYGDKAASPDRAALVQAAHAALTGMGFKSGEARTMIDRASPRVGASSTWSELLRAALREGDVSRVMQVREAVAVYECEPYVPGEWFRRVAC